MTGAELARQRIVLVTVNPAFRPRELHHVLGQSRSAGLLHVAEFRGNDMAGSIEQVRPDLPELREVIDLAGWDELLAGADDAPARQCWMCGM